MPKHATFEHSFGFMSPAVCSQYGAQEAGETTRRVTSGQMAAQESGTQHATITSLCGPRPIHFSPPAQVGSTSATAGPLLCCCKCRFVPRMMRPSCAPARRRRRLMVVIQHHRVPAVAVGRSPGSALQSAHAAATGRHSICPGVSGQHLCRVLNPRANERCDMDKTCTSTSNGLHDILLTINSNSNVVVISRWQHRKWRLGSMTRSWRKESSLPNSMNVQ